MGEVKSLFDGVSWKAYYQIGIFEDSTELVSNGLPGSRN